MRLSTKLLPTKAQHGDGRFLSISVFRVVVLALLSCAGITLLDRTARAAPPAPQDLVQQAAGDNPISEIVGPSVANINQAVGVDNAASDWASVDWAAKVIDFTQATEVSGSLRTILALAIFSLVPAALLMTTSFVRFSIVLGLLRQAIGAPTLPSNQIVTALAMFMTLVVMTPVWTRVYDEAIVPYTDGESELSTSEAWQLGIRPIRQFMSQQIERADNAEDVWLFLSYMPTQTVEPETYDDVPFQALLPAFVLSELKVAFLIGFRIFMPFLIIDLVVASVSTSMGMMMLPPTMVSLPMKLLLFVLVDGWRLVVGMLLESCMI